jgi:hypothetical protein
MSLNPVRTIRTDGFRISSLPLALALVAAGAAGCDVPPEGSEGVQAISSGLMAVVENGIIADSPTAQVQMVFSIARPFDSTTQPLDVVFSTFAFGSNQATAGTACGPGVDYVAVPSRTLTFPANTTTITTSVTVCPDSLIEGTETFGTHVVEAATGSCDGERCAAIGSIIDPPGTPSLPSLRINDVTAHECLKGSCLATFTVSLSAASGADVTVQAVTANDTAIGTTTGCLYGFLHADFAAVNRTVTIPAGATSATVSVPICGDFIAEPIERFFMNLSNPVNATIADGHGVGTIID